MPFLYIKIQQWLCKRVSLVTKGGGKHFSKTFSICWIAKTSFQPIFLNQYLSNEKKTFLRMIRGLKLLLFPWKKHFLKNFFLPFYGHFFIKTVRGPFLQVIELSSTNWPCLKLLAIIIFEISWLQVSKDISPIYCHIGSGMPYLCIFLSCHVIRGNDR